MESVWSRDDLCAWVREKRLFGRDAQGGTVAIPEWLDEHSDRTGVRGDTGAAMENTHPDDRQVLIASFIDSLTRPGEFVSTTLRARDEDDGDWHTLQVEWVNQLDNPDVGAMICAVHEIESAPVEGPIDVQEAGDHDANLWMILSLDGQGVIRGAEGKVEETLGYEAADLEGELISKFMHHHALAEGVANWVALTKTPGATSTSRRPWLRKDHESIWLEASYLNRGDDSILCVVWDITERRAQEQALGDLTAQFRVLADEVPSAVFCCDAEGRVLFHNARWSQLVPDQPAATNLQDLVAHDDRAVLLGVLANVGGEDHAERRTIDVRSPDGGAVWRIAVRSTGDADRDGGSLVGSIEDVTANIRLHREARHDALTGLLNRQGLDEHLGLVLAEGAATTLVVFMDLDGFKEINDAHGHDAGDAVLVEVGHRLTAALRPGDAVGRYGGDEFVVVCTDVAPGGEQVIVNRLETALAEPVSFPGGRWVAAASIGTARSEPDGDLAGVLRRADLHMFEEKRRRKSQCGDVHSATRSEPGPA